jgi:hypothetical protein
MPLHEHRAHQTTVKMLEPEPVFVNVKGAQESIPPAYVAYCEIRDVSKYSS